MIKDRKLLADELVERIVNKYIIIFKKLKAILMVILFLLMVGGRVVFER